MQPSGKLGITAPNGFRAAGVACGLKKDGALDLALVVSDGDCTCAGVFTTNRVKAAPVLYDQQVLAVNRKGIPAVGARDGGADESRAIMTTDTRPKTFELRASRCVIGGMCKGAGMIHPHMATMLAVITTDAKISPALLDQALRVAADTSFNRSSVYGRPNSRRERTREANPA